MIWNRECEFCHGTGIAPGDGKTECGFCEVHETFTLTPEEFEKFERLLDDLDDLTPHLPKLKRLLQSPTVFEEE